MLQHCAISQNTAHACLTSLLLQKVAEELQAKYEDARAQLEEKEAYTRILNLERRWQHQEQNNFAAREFVQAKLAEHNYHSIKQDVQVLLDSYNTFLQESLARGPPALA